jgi:xylan 1,4-beta-xylosidase
MVWHYHDDDLPGPDAAIDLVTEGFPGQIDNAKLTHYRIDENTSNCYSAWKRMKSPIAPNEGQYRQLEEASDLGTIGPPEAVAVTNGVAHVKFSLPRQGVSLLVFKWGM